MKLSLQFRSCAIVIQINAHACVAAYLKILKQTVLSLLQNRDCCRTVLLYSVKYQKMVRNYQCKTGARAYKNYTGETMKKALEDVPELGLKGSSKLHKVPYDSLFNKFHGKHTKPHGTPQW